jgi:Fe(II)/alpha-ketoglutarate-dependent arginine beta-hydroxylase
MEPRRWNGPVVQFDPANGDRVPRVELGLDDSAAIRDIAEALLAEEPGRPLEERLDRVALYAHRMPDRIRTLLTEFRLTGRPYGGFVVSGLPVDESQLGRTPTSYTDRPSRPEVQHTTAVLLLIGSLLGDPFSFYTQQLGRLVLDVFPVPGHEQAQLGSSSTVTLEWHNEDAFHPYRADWILLLGLRNPYRVATIFAPIQDVGLDAETMRILFEERFVILPDESHTAAFNEATTGIADGAEAGEGFTRIARMNTSPCRLSILSGDRKAPFIRIDPAFMDHSLGDPHAEKALDAVIEAINRSVHDVVLTSGEMLIIDNLRAVHGRRLFRARYDGTDRWLQRINVTADLRKAEGRRFGVHGRAII